MIQKFFLCTLSTQKQIASGVSYRRIVIKKLFRRNLVLTLLLSIMSKSTLLWIFLLKLSLLTLLRYNWKKMQNLLFQFCHNWKIKLLEWVMSLCNWNSIIKNVPRSSLSQGKGCHNWTKRWSKWRWLSKSMKKQFLEYSKKFSSPALKGQNQCHAERNVCQSFIVACKDFRSQESYHFRLWGWNNWCWKWWSSRCKFRGFEPKVWRIGFAATSFRIFCHTEGN